MSGRWREIVTATVLSVGMTAGLAVAVAAEPSTAQDTPARRVAPVGDASAPAAPSELPPVTEHELDPALLASARAVGSSGGQSVTEIVTLTVVGGSLELAQDEAVVTLERVSEREWAGVLPPIRVVDARGTHEGWDVHWAAAGIELTGTSRTVPLASIRLDPEAPVVVAGEPEGLQVGRPGPGVGKGRTLFASAPGFGGGTYEAGGTVSARLPADVDADSVVVSLSLSVA